MSLQVKGTLVKTNVEVIRERFGQEGYDRWIGSLPTESKAIYNSPILSSSWYPYEHASVVPLSKLVELFYDGDFQGLQEIGRLSADRDLNGIYKVFVRLGSVSWLFKVMDKLTATLYRGDVRIETEKADSQKFLIRQYGFPGHSQVNENISTGWMRRAMEISGAREISISVNKSPGRGDSYGEVAISWR